MRHTGRCAVIDEQAGTRASGSLLDEVERLGATRLARMVPDVACEHLRWPLYALAVHPPRRVPAALNGFALWNVLVLLVRLLAHGYPTGLHQR